jgi:hypothetical protein
MYYICTYVHTVQSNFRRARLSLRIMTVIEFRLERMMMMMSEARLLVLLIILYFT